MRLLLKNHSVQHSSIVVSQNAKVGIGLLGRLPYPIHEKRKRNNRFTIELVSFQNGVTVEMDGMFPNGAGLALKFDRFGIPLRRKYFIPPNLG